MALSEEQAERIVERADIEFGLDWEVYARYSGRGMYGAETTGIVIGSTSELVMLGWIARGLWQEDELDISDEDLPTRRDSLGTGTIVY